MRVHDGDRDPAEGIAGEGRELSRGLRYTHFRANANTNQLIQVLSAVEAATSILEEKGILERNALEKRKAEVAEGIGRDFASKGLGVQLDQSNVSKYEVQSGVRIDCENRVSLCKAACCKMHFALSGEDLEEGKIRWDLGRPYVIAQGDDGWCVHLDRKRLCCGVYESRPLTCRTYDCRGDSRIWLDFENRIINPQIHTVSWPRKVRATESSEEHREQAKSIEEAPGNWLRSLCKLLSAHPQVWARGDRFISAYGLFLSLGFALAAMAWLAKVHSLGDGWGALFLPVLVIAAYAGSRLLRVAEGWLDGLLRRQRREVAGHTLYGGLVAGIGLAAWWWMAHPAAWWIVDYAVPAIALGLAIAKLGCLGSGCCIGCPTARNPSVSYSHPLSKAVAFYGLAGIPLVPLQLYESAFGLAAAAGFLLLPENWFGEGRVLGLFLVALSIYRTLLLPFRYRLPGARAGALISNTLHLVFVTIGAGLIVAAPGTLRAARPESGTSTVALASSVLAAAILALLLFGVHSKPKLSPGQSMIGGKS